MSKKRSPIQWRVFFYSHRYSIFAIVILVIIAALVLPNIKWGLLDPDSAESQKKNESDVRMHESGYWYDISDPQREKVIEFKAFSCETSKDIVASGKEIEDESSNYPNDMPIDESLDLVERVVDSRRASLRDDQVSFELLIPKDFDFPEQASSAITVTRDVLSAEHAPFDRDRANGFVEENDEVGLQNLVSDKIKESSQWMKEEYDAFNLLTITIFIPKHINDTDARLEPCRQKE